MSKKIIFSMTIFFVLGLAANVNAITKNNWTPVSNEQKEIEFLSFECDRIAEYFTSLGAGAGSGCAGEIFGYLKNVGTPVSLKVLKGQIAAGRVPANYLNLI